jgi:hypothetical protein
MFPRVLVEQRRQTLAPIDRGLFASAARPSLWRERGAPALDCAA